MRALLLAVVFLFLTMIIRFVESFDTVVSKLERDAGFFSMLFFLLNHYIYCKKTRTNFKVDTSNWLYTYKVGWLDYFEQIDLSYNEGKEIRYATHNQVLDNFSIIDYKNHIHEIYKYNQKTRDEIHRIKTKLELMDGLYDSIYIRRGDKLANESKFIPEEKYVDLLLERNPGCSYIFLQTDDYNCYVTIEKYIASKNLNIRLETLCNKESVGFITHNRYKDELNVSSNTNEDNKEYLKTIKERLNKTTSLEDMTADERYAQSMELIVGIDIVIHSNVCVTDYQSNVARFIKLAHMVPENVYDVNSPNQEIDYNKKVCPAHSF